jgi:hypothetical protein
MTLPVPPVRPHKHQTVGQTGTGLAEALVQLHHRSSHGALISSANIVRW